MEGVPKTEANKVESVENLSEWRELKEQASAQAKELIEAVDNFAEMEDSEQVVQLQGILGDLQTDNENRFIAEVIASQLALTEETIRHAERMEKLGVAV